MKVREIMTSGSLATATLDTTVEEIASMMKAEDVGAIPVLDDNEKLAGIITDRDIVVRAIAEGEDPTECTAEDILSGQLHTIEPDTEVEEALDLMSRHQIRRLPVVEDEQVIGIISLGDVSVKSQQADAGEALEDISAGVRRQSGGQADNGRNRNGGRDNQRAQGRSSGEQVAEEESRQQSGRQDTALRGNAQTGGNRAESRLAGRKGNASQSRQSLANDLVNREGEEESEFQNAGGGQSRQRANQQNSKARSSQGTLRGRQDSRGRQGASSRGRQDTSARGRESGPVRGEESRSQRGNSQGITNRSARQENQRQQKVAPMRAEGKNARASKRRAS